MADMGNLVTTDIGIIAFWNALDHRAVPGVGDVDPTDCIPVFTSYAVYDNGIEGYRTIGSGRYFHARVKSDGWMIAWIDRSNTFYYPSKLSTDFGEGAHKGYYDILYNWFAYNANISSTQTTLSYLISLLYNALSNKTDFTYADAAVGHYCYEFPLANAMTLTDIQDQKSSGSATTTGQIQYTSGVELYHASVAASSAIVAGGRSASSRIKFAGQTLTDIPVQGGSVQKYAAADLIAEGWIPNPLTNYALEVYVQSAGNGGVWGYADGAILVIWK